MPPESASAASYEASIYLKREGRKLRRTFPTLAGAKAWRAEALTAANKGALRAPKPTTVREAWEDWYRGRGPARPQSLGGPLQAFLASRLRAKHEAQAVAGVGGGSADRVASPDLQELADGLLAAGLDPSTIRSTFLPLRAIYRHAVARGRSR